MGVVAQGNGDPSAFSGHHRSPVRSPGSWGWGPSPGWGSEEYRGRRGMFPSELSQWDSFLPPDVQLETLQPDLRTESAL